MKAVKVGIMEISLFVKAFLRQNKAEAELGSSTTCLSDCLLAKFYMQPAEAQFLVGWRGVRMGSQISRSEATAFWISWAPDPSLLVGSHSLPKEYMTTPRGQYKKLACEFSDYPRVRSLFKEYA